MNERWKRIIGIGVVLALGVVGLTASQALLRGGAAWLVFLLFAFSGAGFLVARIARVSEPDLGLRAAWGIGAYLAVGGVALAAGIASRPLILLLLGAGAAGFVWRELVTEQPLWAHTRRGVRSARENPALAALIVVLAIVGLVQVLGAVAALDRNPWDDDVAYTPMIKRLLDIGDLIEPFSFRRLGAYGGQLLLGAAVAARGAIDSVHALDRGLMFAIAMLLVLGYSRERGTRAIWVVVLSVVLLLLPDVSINTAAHWSGFVLFFALYRTVVRDEWPLVGLVAAATCTLRQNYLVVVVLFLAFVLYGRLAAARAGSNWREAWPVVRPRFVRALAVAAAALAPWCIAALLSSGTFLYPIVDGTWNHALSVSPSAATWTDKLAFLLWACIDTAPLIVMPVIVVVLAVVKDGRPSRPLVALCAAVAIGFVMVANSIAGAAEPSHVWRYSFGFVTALVAILVLEVGDEDSHETTLVPLGRWLLLGALVLQLAVSRAAVPKRYAQIFSDLREAATMAGRGDPAARAEAARYRALQAAIPAGAAAALLLDDPRHLDFARNPLANLDTPGFASPGPQLPMFRGADAMRHYLVGQGYRYLMFVRPDHSRYAFRREFWLWRYFNDNEFFQIMSAYHLATIDTFAELATTSTVLYDKDGLVALDLGAVGAPAAAAPDTDDRLDERALRTRWMRELAARENLSDAFSLSSRDDVVFADGVANLEWVDAGVDDPGWYAIARADAPKVLRGKPIRGLFRRAHIRVRGTQDMRLVMQLAVGRKTIFTRPRLDVSLDGELIASAVATENGRYTIDVIVPAARLSGGWHDLYLLFSSVAEPDKETRDLRNTRLESFEWNPLR